MRLDLRDIIHIPGAAKDFHGELDLSLVELFGERPFDRPVEIGDERQSHAEQKRKQKSEKGPEKGVSERAPKGGV